MTDSERVAGMVVSLSEAMEKVTAILTDRIKQLENVAVSSHNRVLELEERLYALETFIASQISEEERHTVH